MNIVNLTEHDLNLHDEDGNLVMTVPPSGRMARLGETRRKLKKFISGVPIFNTTYGELKGLPAPQVDTIYVVSGMTRAECKDREDVYQPGELIRDEAGRVIGAVGLSQ